MSIEQLREDLTQVAARIPSGPLTSAAELAAYIKNDLVPFIGSAVDEIEEIDESVGDLVNQTPDALHEETAAVFAGIIASGSVLAGELRARAGNDQRLLALLKEWGKLAEKGKELLDDITIPDEVDEAEETDGEADAKPAETPTEGKTE
jgi:hypothetical protein